MISPNLSPTGEIPEGLLLMEADFGQPAPFLALSGHPVEASEVVGQANQRPFARHLLFAA